MKIDEAIEWMKEINHDYVKGDASEEDIQKYTASYMAIKALELQKKFDDGFFIPKDYHDKVYEKLFERYTNALESQRWIPVSERLPTNEDADKYGRVQTFDGFYVDRARWYEIKGDYEFTHWMKMTEPPEVE